MNLIEQLNWRYATKKMDSAKTVEQEKIDAIIEAIRLAPTSSGLQPFELLVITNSDIKKRIKAISYDQPQVSECSHLLVFAAWDNYTPERINMMFDLVNQERGFINEGWEAYRQKLLNDYPQRNAQINFEHAARQAYIALGVAVVAAAEQQVDSVPIEGFEPEKLDAILNLPAQGLRSVVIMPLGYRDATNDWLVNLKKVRRSTADFVRLVD